ncbi:glycosyltransferase family 2 protein [Paenibacillus aceris]|uniref:Glycosyltransferase involved in cell wall biosynthesis n=1 Tax=Paenibacillus aceris TaxID=869555 RepID=A0ABS4I9A7_9BACL|nr:glycosyltransferase family 2 protein [Paenibacillus aceris]MBP1967061.1 glycosyltransferase involved in cell wall biosynthesis [Paenibacillus aceris]NHW33258.1 glycosyltransferase family 2 protein [Paenibacillus aceris]
MSPLISIIVPIYNVEPYLQRCVDSILSQTLNDIEIILVNDGSTDLSGVIADKYALKDPRVIVVHKRNEGQSSARNAGLEISNGEYIGFIDSDDWVDPEMFEGLYKAAKESQADISVCGRLVYSEKGILEGRVELPEKIFDFTKTGLEEYVLDSFLFPHTPSVCNKLYKRNLIEFNHLRFEDTKFVGSEDTLFNYSALCHTVRLCSISQLYYKGTARVGSTARTYKKGEMFRTANLLKRCREYSHKVGNAAIAERVSPYMFLYFQQRNINLIHSVYHKKSVKIIANELKEASSIPYFKNNAIKLIFRHECSRDMQRKGYRLSGRMVQRLFMLFCVLNMYTAASRLMTTIYNIGKGKTG